MQPAPVYLDFEGLRLRLPLTLMLLSMIIDNCALSSQSGQATSSTWLKQPFRDKLTFLYANRTKHPPLYST